MSSRAVNQLISAPITPNVVGALLVAACVAFAGGCGQKVPQLASVTGRITYLGQPVSEGSKVLFSNAEKGTHITAKLDEDGRYRVEMAEGFGLPPGSYRVAILPPMLSATSDMLEKYREGGPPPALAAFPKIPIRYRKTDTSGLILDLPPTGAVFDLDMTPELQADAH